MTSNFPNCQKPSQRRASERERRGERDQQKENHHCGIDSLFSASSELVFVSLRKQSSLQLCVCVSDWSASGTRMTAVFHLALMRDIFIFLLKVESFWVALQNTKVFPAPQEQSQINKQMHELSSHEAVRVLSPHL